jgi:hypothetical protein
MPPDGRFSQKVHLKIVKGLYFLIRKQPFPSDGAISIVGLLNESTKPLVDFIEQNLLPPTFSFGDDVFEWRFCQTHEGMTMLRLSFYRIVVFYAVAADDAEVFRAEEADGN